MKNLTDRVVMIQPFVGLLYGLVCAVKDASDKEILDEANRISPPGTSSGWGKVIRVLRDANNDITSEDERKNAKELLPIQCDTYSDRMHYFILC
jgi:hypothetical protein